MKLVLLGNSECLLLGLLGITQSFYFCTLEEFYIGGLFLGVGNGVTDGSLILISLYIFTGIKGQEWWLQMLDINIAGMQVVLQYNNALLYIIVISQVLAVLYNLFCIVRHSFKSISPE